jgi:putative ABC transport system permease protein
VAGTIAAALLGGLIRSLLFGVQPFDPVIMASVALLLGAVALVACAIPALHASRVDPVRALVGD